ncbi:MAG: septum site-determining protein MinC [Deltaproteobacteria bacterium]|nr:MAG: septum site-determining protein MinC [Deltaproteobacteria bacterium]
MPQPEPTDLEPASATAPEAPDVDASTAPAPQAGQALDLDPDDILDAELQTPTPSDELEPEPEPAEEESGVRTLHVPRTLRSGHAVSFDGDVTIFGDVNPGAQITAAGSVIVLGTLKGVVHAGATGDEQAFILCLQLQATQLRIGTRIAIPPKEGSQGPEVALVREGRIVIEPYRSRLPR